MYDFDPKDAAHSEVFGRLTDGERVPGMRELSARAETVYQEAIARAKEHRRNLSEAVPESSIFVGKDVLVWDLYYPSWNCLLVKERVGRIGDLSPGKVMPEACST